MRVKCRRAWRALLIAMVIAVPAHADDFGFKAPASVSDPGVSEALRDLAERILPVYQEPDQDRYLANLSVLQMIAGQYAAADGTRQSLRERRRGEGGEIDGRAVVLDLYAHARARAQQDNVPPAQAFADAYRETVPKLADEDAAAASAWLGAPGAASEEPVQRALDRARNAETITLDDALHLMWSYLALEADRSFAPQLATLAAQEDARRFSVDGDVVIRSGGARIHARVVRPKTREKLTTLFEFTLAGGENDARAAAARGYAGVVAYVRGKDARGGKTGEIAIPFEHDGEDARAVIRWITQQPWSDGRVGMYGAGYAGFTPWAVARRAPKALKAIATVDALAPGIDFPAEGRVFRNSAYRWAYTNTQPDAEALDDAQWRSIDQAWYRSGKSYADLDRLAKRPSRAFHRWIGHPTYDHYWRRMIPDGSGFARVDVPVLSIAGIAGHVEAGTLHYFVEHTRHRKKADHTLVLGAHDNSLQLALQWFDHVLRGARRPELLADRVNFELAGAGEWRHAASLDAMRPQAQRLYLDTSAKGTRHALLAAKPKASGSIAMSVDFRDRSDAAGRVAPDAVLRNPALAHAVVFASEPLAQGAEITGLWSGELELQVNKQDVDLRVGLYEQLADNTYQPVSDAYEFRASYAADRTQRHPLVRGVKQKLTFVSEQIASRRLQPGSRLLVVLAINKRPDRQINYGSGKDVSEESIADARRPTKLQWLGGFVDLPIKR